MIQHSRFAETFRCECNLMGVVWRSSKCLPSRIAVALGVGGALVPWMIPVRMSASGYCVELIAILAGLVTSRLLIPPRLEYRFAPPIGSAGSVGRNRRPNLLEMPSSKVRAALLTWWLVFARRIIRLGAYSANFLRKFRSRWTASIRCVYDPGSFLFTLCGYRLWWWLRSPFAPFRSDSSSLIVIGGAARSGTTLLRTILGRHPMIASGPETTVFLYRVSSPRDIGDRLGWDPAEITRWQRDSRSQVEFIERFQDAMLDRTSKPLWAEKTPRNVRRFGFIRRRFPSAKLVHIVRDGRDVVCSLRRTPFAKLDQAPSNSIAAARRCAVQWRTSVAAGLLLRGDPAYHELRYEELVLNPEPTLRDLLKFLNVPWDDCILGANKGSVIDPDEATAAGEIFVSSIGRWRRDLPQADRKALRPLIGPLVIELGYDDDLIWSRERPASAVSFHPA